MMRNPNDLEKNESQNSNKNSIANAIQPITQNIFNAIDYKEWSENTELMVNSNTFKSRKDCSSRTCS
jgi:hypothetical protein